MIKPKKGSFDYTYIYFISQNLIFFLFGIFLLLSRNHLQVINFAFVSLLLSVVTSEGIKYIHFKSRPKNYLFGVTHDSSFPSTHATASFALAFTYAFTSGDLSGSLLLLTMAGFVSWGRVLSGAHFKVDVFAGLAIALIASLLVSIYQIGIVLGLYA
ncbi:phosphatase PAP2 family protein [bacterium]|nr:phosphatase PAP2 family protein [bacterium]